MKHYTAVIFFLVSTVLACTFGSASDPAATETAIAAQVMTQLASQTPNPVVSEVEPSQFPTPNPQSATLQPPAVTQASDFQLPTSDFTPCSGYNATTPDGKPQQGLGPWASRLMLAFSDDGLNFPRANQILADQADVPDTLVTGDGEIRVYFIIMCPEEVRNKVVVALSRDAVSWTYKKTTINGLEGLIPAAVDPTVERTPDGKYRLYFTSAPQEGGFEGARSYSAISEDGYTFTREDGERFAQEGGMALAPNVLLIGGTWHYFAGGVPGSNYHATSTDGLNFTRADNFMIENILMANGLAVDGGYRYYGFVQRRDAPSYIRSLFTTDGVTWTVDPGNRLELDTSNGLESGGVKDPGVTRLPDGRYLMIYSTIIQGYPTPQPPSPGGGPPPTP